MVLTLNAVKFPTKNTVNPIRAFENHFSILKIKEVNSGCRFFFENVKS